MTTTWVVQCDEYTTEPMTRRGADALAAHMNGSPACRHEHVVLQTEKARRPGTNFHEEPDPNQLRREIEQLALDNGWTFSSQNRGWTRSHQELAIWWGLDRDGRQAVESATYRAHDDFGAMAWGTTLRTEKPVRDILTYPPYPTKASTDRCPHCGFEGTATEVDDHRTTGVHDDRPQAGGNLRNNRPTN